MRIVTRTSHTSPRAGVAGEDLDIVGDCVDSDFGATLVGEKGGHRGHVSLTITGDASCKYTFTENSSGSAAVTLEDVCVLIRILKPITCSTICRLS